MITHRRNFQIAKEQPHLRPGRTARRRPAVDPARAEADFWRSFNLEKFAQDWRRGLGKPSGS